VADSGEGIAPEDLPYAFDRFWRGDRARTHGKGAGSGLGLAIARQLIQSQGGHIDLVSQPGLGTTFTIDLPRAATVTHQ
jgi:signal transduction histidine kinase